MNMTTSRANFFLRNAEEAHFSFVDFEWIMHNKASFSVIRLWIVNVLANLLISWKRGMSGIIVDRYKQQYIQYILSEIFSYLNRS